MINSKEQPEGTAVVCTDPSGKEDSVSSGITYVIEHWDGCCIHITGDDGIGATLNRSRFEPF